VESIPGKVSGAWVFKDTRLPAATIIENLEDLSVDEVMPTFGWAFVANAPLGIVKLTGFNTFANSPLACNSIFS
jgi:hypothetical protein